MAPWQIAVLLVHGLLLVALAVLAWHRLALAIWARKLRRPSGVSQLRPEELPTVLIQLPLYNERYVAPRVIQAACALDYPAEKLTIEVLDDSTDDTKLIVDSEVARWRARGHRIEVLRREDRTGFKAGALQAGLAHNDSELVAIFDADFTPEPDFLRRLLPEFTDPRVGMVQACWGHHNRSQSPLTRAEAILLDGHFHNEHAGRSAAGRFFNFNGTAGIWRRKTIEDAGGWLSRTLTEDLDLSYRAQLRGWRFVYRGDVVVPGELPEDVCAFKTQQRRWAVGGAQTARLILPEVWRAPNVRFMQRIEASLHLLGNVAYPLLVATVAMVPLNMLARPAHVRPWLSLVETALVFGSTTAWCVFYGVALRRATHRWTGLLDLPMALALGAGLAINNTVGLCLGLFERLGRGLPFARTPKTGASKVVRAEYRAVAPGGALQGWIEVALGMYAAWITGFCAAGGSLGALPFLGLFAWGFLQLGVGSISLSLSDSTERLELSTREPVGEEMTPAP